VSVSDSTLAVPLAPPAPVAAVVAKRALDVTVAAVLLLVAVPVVLVAALGVRLTSPGPALFRQVRVGRGGRPFTMYKLRTFPVDHVDREVSVPTEACPTRYGRFLRRTSLDELPQLLNVLLGDMSLVGPRPERERFVSELASEVPGYLDRLRAPAGITGLAQVRGLHGVSPIAERVAADNEYIDGWTFGSDLRILARTLVAVVRKAR
jgi:lipopolysaccharide/colanic/teichoic acid biosynthesis glycosyltransferase